MCLSRQMTLQLLGGLSKPGQRAKKQMVTAVCQLLWLELLGIWHSTGCKLTCKYCSPTRGLVFCQKKGNHLFVIFWARTLSKRNRFWLVRGIQFVVWVYSESFSTVWLWTAQVLSEYYVYVLRTNVNRKVHVKRKFNGTFSTYNQAKEQPFCGANNFIHFLSCLRVHVQTLLIYVNTHFQIYETFCNF